MQDHLSVFGVVLIPRVVHRFASTGERQSRNQPQLEALPVEKIRQRSMIVPGRFKTEQDRTLETSQVTDQLLKVLEVVRQSQLPSSSASRWLDKNVVIVLGDIYR